MENNKKNNKGLIVFVIFLIVIVIVLLGYIVYDKKNDNSETKTNSAEVIKKNSNKATENEITKSEIIDLYKNYVINSTNNLIDINNIDKWNVDKVVYHGYYNDEPGINYYTLSISYSCKDSSSTCLYREVSDTNNSFELEVSIDKDNLLKLSGETIEDENFKVINREM